MPNNINVTPSILIAVIISVVVVFFGLWVNWRLVAKTGHSGALSLLLLFPIIGTIIILWLAFSEWPVQRELNALRQQQIILPPSYPQEQYPRGPLYPPNPQGPQFSSNPQYPPYR